MEEAYLQLDYELILEKILETTNYMKAYIKSWRKIKDDTREPQIDFQPSVQTIAQRIMEEEHSNPREVPTQQDIQLNETEELHLQFNYELTVETTKQINSTQSYLRPMENIDDQRITLTQLFDLPKITELDIQVQVIENCDNVDNQLATTIRNKTDYTIQTILEEREENFDYFDILRNSFTQMLRFDDAEALLWKPVWHRKKARVRFKNVA
ncbi:uncharacterized protein LOC120308158 [Crotalus tigris]|uniref:uncharacterized protein LOC120308158 n=1 Tax=Crotalus tigris TaxID=88082 RepID=UPI00192F3E33|nr:uncharacterized protein LOC120308158 [Crotalus tigris]